jgi:ABC-2 type transport system permease protein
MNQPRPATPWEGTLAVLWMELLRTSRRGVQLYVRGGVGLLLLLTFAGLLLTRFGLSGLLDSSYAYTRQFLASFTESFTTVVLCGLYVVVLLLTPALVGGTIIEELREGTLEMLRVTPLSTRAILLGKLVARLVQVNSVVLLVLPILSLLQLSGGASLPVMLASLSMTVLMSLSLASYAVWQAISQPSWSRALLRCFGLPLVVAWISFICTYFSAVAVVADVTFNWPWLIGHRPYLGLSGTFETAWDWLVWLGLGIALHGWVTVYSLARAASRLRRGDYPRGPAQSPPPPPPPPPPRLLPARPQPDELPVFVIPRRRACPPIRDDTDPLWWKEYYYESELSRVDERGPKYRYKDFPVVPLGSVLVLSGCCLWGGPSMYPVIWIGGLILATVGLGCLALVRTAHSVSRERTRRTLDALLILPLHRRAILAAKYWATLYLLPRLHGWVLLALAWLLVVGLIAGRLWSPPILLLAGLGAVQVGFLAALGLWASVRASTPARALGLAGAVLLLTQLPPTLLCLLNWPQAAAVLTLPPSLLAAGMVSLPGGWLIAALPAFDPRNTLSGLIVLLGNAGFFALAGWVLFHDACRVFEWQEADPRPR